MKIFCGTTMGESEERRIHNLHELCIWAGGTTAIFNAGIPGIPSMVGFFLPLK